MLGRILDLKPCKCGSKNLDIKCNQVQAQITCVNCNRTVLLQVAQEESISTLCFKAYKVWNENN